MESERAIISQCAHGIHSPNWPWLCPPPRLTSTSAPVVQPHRLSQQNDDIPKHATTRACSGREHLRLRCMLRRLLQGRWRMRCGRGVRCGAMHFRGMRGVPIQIHYRNGCESGTQHLSSAFDVVVHAFRPMLSTLSTDERVAAVLHLWLPATGFDPGAPPLARLRIRTGVFGGSGRVPWM